jgi:hypothetical protein
MYQWKTRDKFDIYVDGISMGTGAGEYKQNVIEWSKGKNVFILNENLPIIDSTKYYSSVKK